jgi:PilZ domain/Gram-negative bacterial TonB protein C-terminal
MAGAQPHFGRLSDAGDRREHPRSASFWLTYVELGEENGGIVLNISESGLAVTAAEPFAEECYPRLRFRLPKSEQWIETSGRVVWTDDTQKGAGIEFVDLAQGDRERIRNWVSTQGSFRDIQERRNLAQQAEEQRAEMSRRRWIKRTSAAEAPPQAAQNAEVALPPVERALETGMEATTKAPERSGESILQADRRRRSELFGGASARPDVTGTEPERQNAALIFAGVIVLAAIFFAMGIGLGKGSFDKWLGRNAKLQPGNDNFFATSPSSPAASESGGTNPAAGNAKPQKKGRPLAQNATKVPAATDSPKQNPQIPAPDAGENSAANQAPASIFVAAPSEGKPPFRLTLPEEAVSASSSLAISSQRSILVPAEPGPDSTHRPKRLQVGALIYHVDPKFPLVGNRQEIGGTVKLRASIGKDGDVHDVTALSGPSALLAPSVSAVREWRYAVTTLDGQPVEAVEDIIIDFRPAR